jgi:hypothetical protein
MSINSLLTDLSSFPRFCLYAFINEANKSMYVSFSKGSGVIQLAKTVCLLKAGIHDNTELQQSFNLGLLELKVLKDYGDSVTPELLMRNEASCIAGELGYKEMQNLPIASYKLHKRVYGGYDADTLWGHFVYVIASASASRVVLGIFEDMMEADAWINESFSGQTQVCKLKIANNERTKRYHSVHGMKLQLTPKHLDPGTRQNPRL